LVIETSLYYDAPSKKHQNTLVSLQPCSKLLSEGKTCNLIHNPNITRINWKKRRWIHFKINKIKEERKSMMKI